MRLKGLTIGGKLGRCPEGRKVRFVPLLAYHHPDRTTWLWYVNLRRAIADEYRGFRYLGPSPFERRWTIQFWSWSIQFVWQESGKYRDHAEQKRSRLSRLLGIKFE